MLAPADDLTQIAGKGAIGRIGGRNFWVGSHRYLEERGREEAVVHAAPERMSAVGHTVVMVGNERHVCGLIALKNAPRPGAPGVLVALRQAGVSHLVLLTGDNRGTADAIRDALHFDEVQAELLPEDKVRAIEQLVQRYAVERDSRRHGGHVLGDPQRATPAFGAIFAWNSCHCRACATPARVAGM